MHLGNSSRNPGSDELIWRFTDLLHDHTSKNLLRPAAFICEEFKVIAADANPLNDTLLQPYDTRPRRVACGRRHSSADTQQINARVRERATAGPPEIAVRVRRLWPTSERWCCNWVHKCPARRLAIITVRWARTPRASEPLGKLEHGNSAEGHAGLRSCQLAESIT